MPNIPRQFGVGQFYHIIKKGVDGRKIFLKDQDYSRFILGLEFFNSDKKIRLWNLIRGDDAEHGQSVLREKLENQRDKESKPIVELMAFALMPNHFHLIVREISSGGISSFMQKMGGYTNYFNGQCEREGNLFQSRYKRIEIKSDAQLSTVFNYVHSNPMGLIDPLWKIQQVRDFAKVKEFLENYKWSSYRDYLDISTFPNAINRDFFQKFFEIRGGCQQSVEDWIKFKADNYVQKNRFNPKDFEFLNL